MLTEHHDTQFKEFIDEFFIRKTKNQNIITILALGGNYVDSAWTSVAEIGLPSRLLL